MKIKTYIYFIFDFPDLYDRNKFSYYNFHMIIIAKKYINAIIIYSRSYFKFLLILQNIV